MRLSMRLPLHLLHLYTNIVSTSPVALRAEPEYANLLDRAACETYCGYSSQLCCSTGYICYTNGNNQAQCSPSVYNPTPATAADFAVTATSTLICNGNQGQTACGDTCCNAGQTCLSPGQCSGATATPAAATTATVTSLSTMAVIVPVSTPGTVTTTMAGMTSFLGLRDGWNGLSDETIVATVTSSSTTTTTIGNTGLDSGSIAGIVIGVIVGIIALAWMCKPITNRNSSEKISSISSRSSRGRGNGRSRR
jgi:hypothetical protein